MRNWKKSGLQVHKDICLENKQQVKALVMAAKKDHFNTKCQECVGDHASVFKIVEQLLHRKCPPAMPKHDNLHSLVNGFSKFFEMKISTIRDQLDRTADSQPNGTSATFIGTKLTPFELTTAAEITKILKKLSIATCGLDPIPTKLLNGNILDKLAPIILLMVTLSFDTEIVPDSLNEALVHPLLKKKLLDMDIFKN